MYSYVVIVYDIFIALFIGCYCFVSKERDPLMWRKNVHYLMIASPVMAPRTIKLFNNLLYSFFLFIVNMNNFGYTSLETFFCPLSNVQFILLEMFL